MNLVLENSHIRHSAPDVAALSHGDLILPRQGWVPALTHNGDSTEALEAAFYAEKASYLEGLAEGEANQAEREEAEAVTFEDYQAAFLAWSLDSSAVASGRVYSGHVAIVDLSEDVPMVIEALWTPRLRKPFGQPGVVRRPYTEWLKSYGAAEVWHGRIKLKHSSTAKFTHEDFVAVARKQVGKPYSIYNLCLGDDSAFYCSKLVWYAAYKGLGIKLDEGDSKRKIPWYSPKMVTHSSHVHMMTEGPY